VTISPLSQNLVRHTLAVEPPKSAPGKYKGIALDILSVAAAASFGYFYRRFLDQEANVLLPVASFAVFAVTSVLDTVIMKPFKRRFLIIALSTLGLLGFFWDKDPVILGICTAVVLGFFVWGELSSRHELNNALKIRFFRTAELLTAKIVTAFVLMLTLLYLPGLSSANTFISEKSFDKIFQWTASLLQQFYPEVAIDTNVQQFAEDLVRYQFENNPAFKALPPTVQEKAIAQGAREIVANMSKRLGGTVSSEQNVSKVAYQFVSETFKGWIERFGKWFWIAWIFAVFLVVRTVGFMLAAVISILAFIVYQLLFAFEIIEIAGESRTHEVVRFT
jgi:hypothetical protein